MGLATHTAGTAGTQEPRTGTHWHVHSHIGNGYLCQCDYHEPLDARGRDAALRAERDAWREFCAQDGTASDTDGYRTDYRITGSVRAGSFTVEDRASMGWARYVSSWTCADTDCYADTDGAAW